MQLEQNQENNQISEGIFALSEEILWQVQTMNMHLILIEDNHYNDVAVVCVFLLFPFFFFHYCYHFVCDTPFVTLEPNLRTDISMGQRECESNLTLTSGTDFRCIRTIAYTKPS